MKSTLNIEQLIYQNFVSACQQLGLTSNERMQLLGLNDFEFKSIEFTRSLEQGTVEAVRALYLIEINTHLSKIFIGNLAPKVNWLNTYNKDLNTTPRHLLGRPCGLIDVHDLLDLMTQQY